MHMVRAVHWWALAAVTGSMRRGKKSLRLAQAAVDSERTCQQLLVRKAGVRRG
jgi:hypothetical protein